MTKDQADEMLGLLWFIAALLWFQNGFLVLSIIFAIVGTLELFIVIRDGYLEGMAARKAKRDNS